MIRFWLLDIRAISTIVLDVYETRLCTRLIYEKQYFDNLRYQLCFMINDIGLAIIESMYLQICKLRKAMPEFFIFPQLKYIVCSTQFLFRINLFMSIRNCRARLKFAQSH